MRISCNYVLPPHTPTLLLHPQKSEKTKTFQGQLHSSHRSLDLEFIWCFGIYRDEDETSGL